MRVLMTGHNGYLGAVMAPLFIEAGHEVTGLDTGYFRECTLQSGEPEIPAIWKDIRKLQPEDLQDFDAVVHLAALSNDPIGNLNSDWTREINIDASIQLARFAKEAGVRRFLFSSSCIMYGMAELDTVDENSPVDPQTDYARSKCEAEKIISAMAGDGFSPTFLRNGTVYGVSARMRFDTVLNNLAGSAVTTNKVVLFSNGEPWRPVVHVRDVARAFLMVLEAPIEKVHNQFFNNGCDRLNHQIIELAETVVRTVPGCSLEILARADVDQRTYKTSFKKFETTFPGFAFQFDIEDGAIELCEKLQELGITHEVFTGPRFIRLKWLQRLLDEGKLNRSLYWS